MRFDPEIARSILLAVEATPPNQHPKPVELEGVDKAIITEHVELLNEAGLLEASFVSSGLGGERYIYARIKRLTFAGHQFLAHASNDTVWTRTLSTVKEKGGAVSLNVLTQLLSKIAAAHFGLTP